MQKFNQLSKIYQWMVVAIAAGVLATIFFCLAALLGVKVLLLGAGIFYVICIWALVKMGNRIDEEKHDIIRVKFTKQVELADYNSRDQLLISKPAGNYKMRRVELDPETVRYYLVDTNIGLDEQAYKANPDIIEDK